MGRSKRKCYPKKRYSSYDEAALILVNAKIERAFNKPMASRRREKRVYYCGDCNGFHLSAFERKI